MIPAALHRGGAVDPVAPGVWVERIGGAAVLHSEDRALLCRVRDRLGGTTSSASYLPRWTGRIWTMYFLAAKADRAIELARSYALPLVDGTRAIRRGYAPTVANDAKRGA